MVYVTDEQIAQYKRDGYLIVRSPPLCSLRQQPDHRAPIHRRWPRVCVAAQGSAAWGLCCAGSSVHQGAGALRGEGTALDVRKYVDVVNLAGDLERKTQILQKF